MTREKAIIFGASTLGKIAYQILKDRYNICYFCDNDSGKWNNIFCGIKIISPKDLFYYKGYKIIIASMYYGEISVQLMNMNLDNIYIFNYCDYDDRTYKKNYSLDKMCDLNVYKNISVSKNFKESFLNDFKQLYSSNSEKYKYSDSENYDNFSKNVLMVAYIFPPIGGGGVQRTLKFVKYLKEFGWLPTVITVGNDFHYEEKDKSLELEVPKNVRIIRIDHKYFNSEQLSRSQVQQIVNLIYGLVDDDIIHEFVSRIEANNCSNRQLIMTPDIYIGWVNSVLNEIESLIDFKKIKVIYTTSYPYSTHLIGFYLKKKYNIPWVADFRDEWTNHSYSELVYKNNSFKYKLERQMEERILNESDIILNVTPISKNNYINNFNVPESKIKVITNGYDEVNFKNLYKLDTKKFIITHIGSMYLNRLPNPVIQSINKLIDEGYINKNSIEIKLIGKVQVDIINELKKIDKYNLIKILGYMEHERSLNEGFNSSVLLLPIGEGEKFKLVYTGKVFEYLRLQNPILALSPKGSIVEELLKDTGCGKSFEYTDLNGIEKYIKEIYVKWQHKELLNKPDINKIKKYERRNLTRSLANIFDEIIK